MLSDCTLTNAMPCIRFQACVIRKTVIPNVVNNKYDNILKYKQSRTS